MIAGAPLDGAFSGTTAGFGAGTLGTWGFSGATAGFGPGAAATGAFAGTTSGFGAGTLAMWVFSRATAGFTKVVAGMQGAGAFSVVTPAGAGVMKAGALTGVLMVLSVGFRAAAAALFFIFIFIIK
jgi:hypothetical protein